MLIRLHLTGELVSERDFRALHPNVGFPEVLSPGSLDGMNASFVMEGPQPDTQPWETVLFDGAEEINGNWFTKYRIGPDFSSQEEQDNYMYEWLEERRTAKLKDLALRRWQAEVGGITLGGIPIRTDDTTQRKLTGAWAKAKSDPSFVINNWKIADGIFGTLPNDVIIAAGDAVIAHQQACFDNEAAITALIMDAATFEELSAISIETGWPT